MRITSELTLDLFRGAGRCEACGLMVRRREAAHIFARGMGNAQRNDHPINVVALCAAMLGGCNCHYESHQGREPKTKTLLAIAAKREGCDPEAIHQAFLAIRALPRNSPISLAEALLPVRLTPTPLLALDKPRTKRRRSKHE